MIKSLLLLSVLFCLSCSQVNRDSQEAYKAKNKFRHGIIPIAAKDIKKNETLAIRVLDTKAVARGKVIYQQKCLNCHGYTGKGDGYEAIELARNPIDLVAATKNIPNFKLYIMISKWKGKMPGWESQFSKKDISDLEVYISHLGKSTN